MFSNQKSIILYGKTYGAKSISKLIGSVIFFAALIVVYSQGVQAASLTVPFTFQLPSSSDIASIEQGVSPTVLAQIGPDVNLNFSETAQSFHTGRLWASVVNPHLEPCVTDVALRVTGDFSVTHIANSIPPPLPNPADQPEIVDVMGDNLGNFTGVLANDFDFAVGNTLPIVLPSTPTTVAAVNAGFKILSYVETRDDVVQGGAQASFHYSGTPQLELTYDDSACPVPVVPVIATPASVVTNVKPSGQTLAETGSNQTALLSLGVGSVVLSAGAMLLVKRHSAYLLK